MLRYRDLISFEPIESVIQLREADDKNRAISLLKTYVISEHMADKLVEDILENLQFERMVDNRGMLIVGNYGSGKSHLMSVVSTLAELPGSSQYLRDERVAEKAKEIEGKFKVIRAEFGAVTMSLRDIICHHLEKGLEEMGIDFTFPAADEVTNNKDMLYEMMDLFHEEYPDQGLLLVIDELLDYLRSRNEQELTLDLGFLREVGEVCSNSRFRFISGVQEMLFDNPSFRFVADSLRRVKERFKETRIVREDIAFVVSERLLKKNEEQKALIREHLSKFTKMYHGLAEDIETYVNMFPIHPSYLEMFERVSIAEKRVALKTISDEIRKLLDQEVPEEATGFISFDNYWDYIMEDSSLRTNERVKAIMDKVNTLKGLIQTSVKRQYKHTAERVVNALAVFRLTTDDLNTPIGLDSESLRDKLFISNPTLLDMDDDIAVFTKTMIDAAVRDLRQAASFQFISLNDENGQYYINIDESIPVDELISQRGEMLSDDQLDSYYFDILKKATEVEEQSTYVSGYKIWLHEIPWVDRRVKRLGYLFFGAPNERSTAQPERDFYIYMLQPFVEPKFKDEEKEDEVFFRLKKKNDEFVKLLRLYGGATVMYHETNTNKKLYQPKMESYKKKLVKWVKDNFVDAYEVVYRGKAGSVLDHGMFLPTNPDTLIDLIDHVAQNMLSQWFEVKYSEYPSFRKIEQSYLTSKSLHTYVRDALNYLNGNRTRSGEAILDGLVLLDSAGNPTTRNSGYARWITDMLEEKGNQVINNNELIELVYTSQGTEDFRLTTKFKLEPDLLVVILGALIQSGEIVVTIGGKTYEAMNFDEFVQLPIQDITYFTHIKKPSGLPIPAIQALTDMFDTFKVDFSDPDSIERAIKQIIRGAKEETERTVEMLANLKDKFQIWEGPLFDEYEIEEITTKLKSLNEFLQGLQVYNTRAKMVNLRYDVDRIEQEKKHLELLTKLENLQKRILDYTKIADYVRNARYVVSPSDEWMDQVDIALDNLAAALKKDENCTQEVAELERLKAEYIEHYFDLHQKNRLNAHESRKRQALLQDKRYDAIQRLATRIELFKNSHVFEQWKEKFDTLKECYQLTPEKLAHQPECTNCHFNPREESMIERVSLEDLDEELDSILENWTETLLMNFNDPVVKESIELLEANQKHLIEKFMEQEQFELPICIDLIQVINLVLKGIHQESIAVEDLMKVFGAGNPITIEEAKRNFEKLLRETVGNNDENRVRLTIKK